MNRLRRFAHRLRGFFFKKRLDRDLDEELRTHFSLEVEENLRRGMSPADARLAALRKFGGVEQTKETYRDRRGLPLLDAFFQDLRYGLRMLRRNPGFAVAVVLTLALGVGANVTMFGVVDALLFRLPEHVRQPGQLVRVQVNDKNGPSTFSLASYPGYRQVADNVHLLDVAALAGRTVDFGRGAEAREIEVEYVTHTYFPLLGTQLLMGRPFTREEDDPAHPALVAILGYDFWQRQFGGDPHALGRAIWIGGQEYTVIGIAPARFTGTGLSSVDAWVPISDIQPDLPGESPLNKSGARWLLTLGRLRQGATRAQAEAEATSAYLRGGGEPGESIRLEPYFALRAGKFSTYDRVSLLLAGVAFVVLLIACANVANLLLARMVHRTHEMAVRLHLGASPGRLVRQVLVESLLLSALGGLAALIFVAWAEPLVRAFLLPPGFFVGDFLNWRMLFLSAFFTSLAGFSVGLAPAWRVSRPGLTEALKSGGRGYSHQNTALRPGLLVAQVAMTLVLTVGAGLFIRSLRKIHAIDMGFEPDHVLVATMNLNSAGYKFADINAIYERLREHVQTVPTVEWAGLSASIPFYSQTEYLLKIPAGPSSPRRTGHAVFDAVGPAYFEAMGIRVLRGRPIQPLDRSGAPPIAIVNESMARKFWPGMDPIGKCLIPSGSKNCLEVVGVVADARTYELIDNKYTSKEGFYVSLAQDLDMRPVCATALIIRTKGKPSAALREVFTALESEAPNSRYVNVRPLSATLDARTRSWRLGASMFSLFGALALSLAAVGVYGVLAFLVRNRTTEIGIRMALGALPKDILRTVTWQGMKFVVCGLFLGIACGAALTRFVRGLLYGVTPADLVSYIGACGLLMGVALLACLVPAWRASRVDPSVALRYE